MSTIAYTSEKRGWEEDWLKEHKQIFIWISAPEGGNIKTGGEIGE